MIMSQYNQKRGYMVIKKTAYLETLILTLLEEKHEISLRDIVEKAGLKAQASADRRAIQRALTSLIKSETIEARGKARARVYILKNNSAKKDQLLPHTENENASKYIFLSQESTALLPYFSKSIRARKSVGYNPDFLRLYIPNQTAYLNPSLREELFAMGNVENIVRPAGTYARNILNRLLIDLAWNSSRLEGNTYSLLETKRLIELGENTVGKDTTETQMILNHKDAIEYIIDSAHEKNISSHEIRSIHALLSENLLGDASASGRLREIAVGISGTTYLPLENPHVLKECFDIFIHKMNLIEDPFEQSFFSLVHLSYLQAFEDVNKRTARLTANIPLIKRNLKPLSFVDVNQKDYMLSLLGVYEKNDVSLLRDLYVWAYKKSSQRYSALQQSIGEPNIFKLKYRDAIQDIIRTIILQNVTGDQVVPTIKNLIKTLNISESDTVQLFQIIETEIMSLHDGNIARFKIRPSEFQKWKEME
jgi:Fic family protein